MSKFQLSVYLCTLLIYQSYCFNYRLGRMFHSPDMCLGKGNKSCSFQFPIPSEDNCLIYNTKICRSYNFSDWNLKPLSIPTTESESEFMVSIVPYFTFIDEIHERDPVNAINISLTSLSEDIAGYSLIMVDENDKSRSICRVFDFRNSLGTFNIPFTIFYDCLRYLTEDGWDKVEMIFRAIPLNMELSYLVYMPPKPHKNSKSVCDWVPLVMIFQSSLPRHHIQIKFSNAPKELKITFFVLTLWDSSGNEERRKIRIPASLEENMLSKDFISVKGGFYSLSIGIISAERSCTVFRSQEFLVGNIQKDYTLLIFIILLIIMFLSGSALLYYSCRWYLKKAVSATKPSVLFIYHYKPLQHDFLIMYGKYLENKYGIKSYTIYKIGGDPKAWLDAKYKESDVIIFVISEGLFQKFEQNISFKEEHPWIKQLSEAKALISYLKNSKIGRKKICKISFPYSGKQHVPEFLEDLGPFFMLPNDEDKFLCFLHNCSRKLYFLNKFCCENHHKIQSPNLNCQDEEVIKKKLSSIVGNRFDALPADNFKTIPEVNLQVEKQTDTLNEECNCIPNNISSCEQEIRAVNLPKVPDNSAVNINSISIVDSLNEHKCENVILANEDLSSKQEPDTEEEENDKNDDFFLYCVRRILNLNPE